MPPDRACRTARPGFFHEPPLPKVRGILTPRGDTPEPRVQQARFSAEKSPLMPISLACLLVSMSSPLPADAGPILGDLTVEGVRIRYCADNSHPLELVVIDAGGDTIDQGTRTPDPAHDHCVEWQVSGLQPGRRYDYLLHRAAKGDVPSELLAASSFQTQAPPDARVPVRVGFGSCANEGAGSSSVWNRMALDKVDAVVLLGDTPYIDTTDLSVQRARHRAFCQVPGFARLAREVPVYATWDDHDFGRNDTDGRLDGKENSRQAFLEYRPNPSAGEDGEGIHTNFRIGDLEIFLLDARWFARTEESEFAPGQPSLLGRSQWAWLRARLAESTAPFKAITTGMIFNGSVRPLKTDYWSFYPHELNALFELIAELELSGVILVGGDIHRQRVVRHDTRKVVGYDLVEFISSPVHEGIIESANQPHPGLLFDGGEVNMYVQLEVDPGGPEPVLRSRFVTATGRVLDERRWSLSQFTPPGGK